MGCEKSVEGENKNMKVFAATIAIMSWILALFVFWLAIYSRIQLVVEVCCAIAAGSSLVTYEALKSVYKEERKP